MKQGQQPRRWEDLADPKWKGKLEMELSDVDWYKTLWEYWVKHGKSPQEADRLFTAMARNAAFVKGHTVMGELLGAGEYAVSASNYSFVTGSTGTLTHDGRRSVIREVRSSSGAASSAGGGPLT